jgi:hypothetical protein
MTNTGKIAVLINLALSLMFAFWGIGLYANRIDWTNQKTGETSGKYAQRDEAIKNLRDVVLPQALARWNTAIATVDDLDSRRPALQDWYAEDLKNLRSGMNPIQALVEEKGVVKIDPATHRPVLGAVLDLSNKPIQGLASVAALNQSYSQLADQIMQVTQEIAKLIEEEKQLSEQIGDGRDKGLRAELAAEELRHRKAVDEQESLKPILYNRQVEHSLLVKRQKALESRIKEMQAVSAARQ